MVHDLHLAPHVLHILLGRKLALGDRLAGKLLTRCLVGTEVRHAELAPTELFADRVCGADILHRAAEDRADRGGGFGRGGIGGDGISGGRGGGGGVVGVSGGGGRVLGFGAGAAGAHGREGRRRHGGPMAGGRGTKLMEGSRGDFGGEFSNKGRKRGWGLGGE